LLSVFCIHYLNANISKASDTTSNKAASRLLKHTLSSDKQYEIRAVRGYKIALPGHGRQTNTLSPPVGILIESGFAYSYLSKILRMILEKHCHAIIGLEQTRNYQYS
jgi:hypothetical protein